ncbi:toxin biosynthesis protein [Mytilinidion resinicola]|uniref:Toxin biosynthesis protein n=1 Tax=Mytilinidion resinicola TaxID=574789 RepID=A0A6A6YB97_9PEZI|nr:toxin biosynthesis protein [Mytilinidion resinicola]KAF2805107.1 toxin biosynthesis protein [Mytilinidion resinicola]
MSPSAFTIKEHVIPCQHIREYHGAVKGNAALQLAIKQYTPHDHGKTSPNAVTIIAAHANGVPKECYEPLWEDLLETLNIPIKSIWIADCSHQGASGVLNESVQGDEPNWFDHSRDLLHMVNHFRDQIMQPIIGVAHSFSCSQLVHLSLMHPSLFHSLVFMEPMIQKENPSRLQSAPQARFSSLRPDIWPSRVEAEAFLRSSPLFRKWDARAVDNFLEFGLRPAPTELYPQASPPGAVTLTTTKAQEAWTFLRLYAFPSSTDPCDPVETVVGKDLAREAREEDMNNRSYVTNCPWPCLAYEFLPYLRPSTLFLFGESSHINRPARREDKLQQTGTGLGGNGGVATGRVKAHVIQGTAHMLPLEKTSETAAHISHWLEKEVRRFGFEEEFSKSYNSQKSECDGKALSATWMEYMELPSGTKRTLKSSL